MSWHELQRKLKEWIKSLLWPLRLYLCLEHIKRDSQDRYKLQISMAIHQWKHQDQFPFIISLEQLLEYLLPSKTHDFVLDSSKFFKRTGDVTFDHVSLAANYRRRQLSVWLSLTTVATVFNFIDSSSDESFPVPLLKWQMLSASNAQSTKTD